MKKLLKTFSFLAVFALIGATSASEVLNIDQLDKVTAGGVASAEALASAAAQSLTGNDVRVFTSTFVTTFEDANDQEHTAISASISRASAGN
jgi:hypothetical protein